MYLNVERYNEMWFEIDVNGIKIKLKINGYKHTSKENCYDEWCRCDFLFSSGDWLNYHQEHDEVLLCSEIDELAETLTELLDNTISEVKEIACIEPDFVFTLYPKKDLRNDPQYMYVPPGYEMQDIYLEWRIYFWNKGLTDNYLTLTLDRNEIASFRDYLVLVKNR